MKNIHPFRILMLSVFAAISGCNSPPLLKSPDELPITRDILLPETEIPEKLQPPFDDTATELPDSVAEIPIPPHGGLIPYLDSPLFAGGGGGGRGSRGSGSGGKGAQFDQCPQDPTKRQEGFCGCGVAETDSDSDGFPDCIDLCPTYPGPNIDTDNDGQADACDCFATSDEVGSFLGIARYVNPTGSDADNDCADFLNPCQTIAHAVLEADPNDAVFLSAGNFIEHSLNIDKNLVIFGLSASTTVIAAHGQGRVFSIDSETKAVLCNLAVTEGFNLNQGGGILNDGNLTLVHARIADNAAPQGGGIDASDGTITKIINSSIENNFGIQFGGGITNAGTLTITNSILKDNAGTFGGGAIGNLGSVTLLDSTVSFNSAPAGGGGAVANGGLLTIIKTTLDNNSADAGGAIANGGGVLIGASTLSNNSANGFGGAISSADNLFISDSSIIDNTVIGSGGGINSDGNVTISASTISGNSAGEHGGGIRQANVNQIAPLISFENSTVSGNRAGLNGGGLYIIPLNGSITSAELENSTFSGNTASNNGGAIHAQFDTVVTLKNSTIAVNTANGSGGGIYNLDSATLTSYHSIIGDNRNEDCAKNTLDDIFTISDFSLFSDTTCTFNSGSDNLTNQDPDLGPLVNNGGPTKTHALLLGSAAIDAGDFTCNVETDQRGELRPVDIIGLGVTDPAIRCDIGAYERQP